MSKSVLVIDTPESCSKCKFMYEFYGVKKCQLLNILQNGGKAILSKEQSTKKRDGSCPLVPVPEKYPEKDYTPIETEQYMDGYEDGYNSAIDAIGKMALKQMGE